MHATPEDIRLADHAEAAAFADLFAAAPLPLSAALALDVRRIGGATVLLAPRVPATFFNRALGLGLDVPATEADLDTILGHARETGCREFWVQITPIAAPVKLPEWLSAKGFALAPRRAWSKMLRGTEPPEAPRTSLQVRPARPGDAEALADAIRQAFEMPAAFIPWIAALPQRPHWHAFVAADGDRVVGGGFLHAASDVGWVGMAGVLPQWRRRGGQQALLSARLQAALDLGCRHVATETGEPIGDEPNPSLANLRRAGFRHVCSRLNYAWKAAD